MSNKDVANNTESVASKDQAALTNVDDNYKIYSEHATEGIDPAEAKRVLRKIDMRIVPILFVTYLLQYLDKNGINYASVSTGRISRYQWMSS